MKHTSAIDCPDILVRGFFDSQCEVAVKFFRESVTYMTRSDILAVASEERTVVDRERHRHCRLVDGYTGQRLGVVDVGYCITDLKALDAYERAYISAGDFLYTFAAHAFKCVKLFYFLTGDCAVAATERYVHAFAQGAPVDTPHCDTAYIV